MAVNDTLGHAAGDRLLTEIAGRLRTCVRPGDVVARLGGDEFTLLLEEISGLPDAEHAARRIQAALVAPFAIEGRELVATASIGVALSEPDYGQPQDLLRDADLAMYHAKEQGRARYQVFDVAMRDSAQARFGMEADLRTALEHGELRLVFQPIVELQTGRVHGFEALLRWHRPDRGVILPPEFVPLAEQTGLIVPIGRWVLQQACRQARRWHEAFPAAGPVRISVNVSGKQLAHPGLAEDVRTALEDAGLSPSRWRHRRRRPCSPDRRSRGGASRSRSQHDQAAAQAGRYRFRPVGRVEFLVDRCEVGLHGVLGYAEPHSDLLVHEPFAQQREDLPFPWGQSTVSAVAGLAVEHRPGQTSRPGCESRCRGSHGSADLLRRGVAGQHGPRAGALRAD